MSADDHDDPSPQIRRLRLRNSLVRPSRLSYGPSCADDSPPRAPSPSPQIDDNGWETEDADTPPPPPPAPPLLAPPDEENVSNSARKRRSRDAPFLPPALLGLSPAATAGSGSSLKPPFPGVNHRRNRSGSEGGGGDRYVDYLERQVADLSAQLQGYTSPAGGAASHAGKLRRLSSEARSLRNELLDWEAKFNVRVKDEVELKAAQDATLRGRVRALEAELDEALERAAEAEEECDAWHRRAVELEGVNRALEVRVEALASMLAEATRGERGVSRSRSRARRGSSEVGAGAGAAGMERCVTIGTATATPAESRRGSVDGGASASSPGSSPGRRLEDYGITDPIDAVLLTMTSSSSPPLPLPSAEPLRSRRMRRFPSGSTAPKTLVLPPSSSPPPLSSSPTAPDGSPTLPTLRTFFNTPIADPSSMFSSRPSSSSSSSSSVAPPATAPPPPPPRPPLPSTDSLFAELARAENDSVADAPDTFALVSDAMTNPTPLLIRAAAMVGAGIRSPTGTLLTARRTALDMLTGVVGKGVERVSRRRALMLQHKSREARRRIESAAEGRARRQHPHQHQHQNQNQNQHQHHHHHHERAVSVALAVGPAEDAVEHVWLWVRFVVALVVALGVAVKEGPAVVLAVDGGDYDGVVEEERECAIRALGETRAQRMRREWRGLGEERLRLGEGGRGVQVGDGRRKAMEWG